MALETLAAVQARGGVVSKELLVDCFVAGVKSWVDSPQARDLIAAETNRAFDLWNAATDGKAN